MKYNKILSYLLLIALTILMVWGISILIDTNFPDMSITMPHEADESSILQSTIIPTSSESISSNDLLYLVIAVLSLTTLFSIGISFYLYKWRRILLSNKNMVVPEEWAKSLQDMGRFINELSKEVGSSLHSLVDEAKNNTVKISGMTDTYMELQSSLDEKDKEIKRLKDGYDAEIFSRFIARFARIDQSIDDFILEDGESGSLSMLRRLFEDAFDECGVSKYVPDVGSDYRKAIGVSDNPKVKITDNPDKEFLICEILESGYQMNTALSQKVIIPSKVKIYKLG